jgi:hypothetical protein
MTKASSWIAAATVKAATWKDRAKAGGSKAYRAWALAILEPGPAGKA